MENTPAEIHDDLIDQLEYAEHEEPEENYAIVEDDEGERYICRKITNTSHSYFQLTVFKYVVELLSSKRISDFCWSTLSRKGQITILASIVC